MILTATLTTIPAIPVIGLVLLLSIDWFVGIARALGNLLGNCVAAIVVAAWEKDIGKTRACAVLNGEIPQVIPDQRTDSLAPFHRPYI